MRRLGRCAQSCLCTSQRKAEGFQTVFVDIGRGQNPMNTAPKSLRVLTTFELSLISGGIKSEFGTRENEGGTGDKSLIIRENEGGTGLV
jgi:hypothetical protein